MVLTLFPLLLVVSSTCIASLSFLKANEGFHIPSDPSHLLDIRGPVMCLHVRKEAGVIVQSYYDE